jgi:hypothetical protein
MRSDRQRYNSWTSKGLALKPGTMSGRGCFLSTSLVVSIAWCTCSTASGSTWRTRGGARWCGEWCPSAFNSFELPSWMLYQDVQLLWDSGLVRGESGYSL